MRPLLEYHKLAHSLNLGQCKTGRLIATINFLVKHGIEPDVVELSKLSRKDIKAAQYEAIQTKVHRDNLIDTTV